MRKTPHVENDKATNIERNWLIDSVEQQPALAYPSPDLFYVREKYTSIMFKVN